MSCFTSVDAEWILKIKTESFDWVLVTEASPLGRCVSCPDISPLSSSLLLYTRCFTWKTVHVDKVTHRERMAVRFGKKHTLSAIKGLCLVRRTSRMTMPFRLMHCGSQMVDEQTVIAVHHSTSVKSGYTQRANVHWSSAFVFDETASPTRVLAALMREGYLSRVTNRLCLEDDFDKPRRDCLKQMQYCMMSRLPSNKTSPQVSRSFARKPRVALHLPGHREQTRILSRVSYATVRAHTVSAMRFVARCDASVALLSKPHLIV